MSNLGDKIYIYSYSNTTNKYSEEAIATLKDGYYEYEIDHNSTFVLVNEKIPKSLIDEGSVVVFQESNRVHILLIVLGVVVVIGLIVFIILMKKKNNKAIDNMFEEPKNEEPKVENPIVNEPVTEVPTEENKLE